MPTTPAKLRTPALLTWDRETPGEARAVLDADPDRAVDRRRSVFVTSLIDTYSGQVLGWSYAYAPTRADRLERMHSSLISLLRHRAEADRRRQQADGER